MVAHWKARVRPVVQGLRLGGVLPLSTAVRWYGGTDKGLHRYTEPYSVHLRSFRYRQVRVLEIGVGGDESHLPGGSLRVWRDYLPRARVVGMDLYPKDVRLGRRVRFMQGDQGNLDDLDRLFGALGGPPDIVVDDGSHLVDHGRISFEHLFPTMPSGALYAIEDVHTSYWPKYGGGVPPSSSTAIGLCRDLIDDVQAQDQTFHQGYFANSLKPGSTHPQVGELHVYPGLFIVKKA